jgi:hypothetical protein
VIIGGVCLISKSPVVLGAGDNWACLISALMVGSAGVGDIVLVSLHRHNRKCIHFHELFNFRGPV